MTKKDFELIAATLKQTRDRFIHDPKAAGTVLVLDCQSRAFADSLKATNKQFNRDKFLHACGVSP
jgi:hypothetical protein